MFTSTDILWLIRRAILWSKNRTSFSSSKFFLHCLHMSLLSSLNWRRTETRLEQFTVAGSIDFTGTNMEKLKTWTRTWPSWCTHLSRAYSNLFKLDIPFKVENVEYINRNVGFRNLLWLSYDKLFAIINNCLTVKVNS